MREAFLALQDIFRVLRRAIRERITLAEALERELVEVEARLILLRQEARCHARLKGVKP